MRRPSNHWSRWQRRFSALLKHPLFNFVLGIITTVIVQQVTHVQQAASMAKQLLPEVRDNLVALDFLGKLGDLDTAHSGDIRTLPVERLQAKAFDATRSSLGALPSDLIDDLYSLYRVIDQVRGLRSTFVARRAEQGVILIGAGQGNTLFVEATDDCRKAVIDANKKDLLGRLQRTASRWPWIQWLTG
jgi:hypothetical protein